MIVNNYIDPFISALYKIIKPTVRTGISIITPFALSSLFIRFVDKTNLSFNVKRSINAATAMTQLIYDGHRLTQFIRKLKTQSGHAAIRVAKQVIPIAAPLLMRLAANTLIENCSFDPRLKTSLTFATASLQWIYDSYRLNKFSNEIQKTTPQRSQTQRMAHYIRLTAKVTLACGIFNGISSIKHLHYWYAYPNLQSQIAAEEERVRLQQMEDQGIVWQEPGNHDGCSGNCNPETVQSNFSKLQKRSSSIVSFQEQFLNKNNLTGGTCSAMSLSLAYDVQQEKCIEQQSTSCIKNIIHRNYLRSGEQFRNLQAAFNAITINPKDTDETNPRELIREKMAALSSFFDFQVIGPCDITNAAKFSDGIYLGRAIAPSNNHKLEIRGHTIVCIIIGNQGVLYDPNSGGTCYSEKGLTQTLKKTSAAMMRRWNLPEPVFFQLQHT